MEDPMTQNLPSKDEFGQTVLSPRKDYEQVITVLLSNNSPQIRKDLHCINCGRIVAQYYSEARVIIIGEMREVSRPVDIMCSRNGCKILYRIG